MLYHMHMRNKDVCTVMLVLHVHVCTNLGFHFVGSLVPRTLALSIRSSAANAIATRSVVYNNAYCDHLWHHGHTNLDYCYVLRLSVLSWDIYWLYNGFLLILTY